MYEACVYRTLDSINEINRKMPEVTRRDLFAMSVINTILQSALGQETSNEDVAASAYSIADAMEQARKKKN